MPQLPQPQPDTNLANAKYSLRAQIVTMDGGAVHRDGVVCVDGSTGLIAAVLPDASQARPAGWEAEPIRIRGTIYPGLIELHNHLCYNMLTLWRVPRQYEHHNQWPGAPEYRKLVTGPAQTLGIARAFEYLPAIVRYVECKCLVAGVTASQGITLNGVGSAQTAFRGTVRNVEIKDPLFPKRLLPAEARIGELTPQDVPARFENMKKLAKEGRAYLLHLCEGVAGPNPQKSIIREFMRLNLQDRGEWAVTRSLVGIHCVALGESHWDIMRDKGASMVWSPMSNLLLYGETADMRIVKSKGIRIGIGSDWSPSGSKNLLGELKVAQLYSREHDNLFTDQEIVAMATVNAAEILGWQRDAGTVTANKVADLLVIAGTSGDHYSRLIKATEKDVYLVTIGGVPRYGRKTLVSRLVKDKARVEPWKVGRASQAFHLDVAGSAPLVVDISMRDATRKLADGLAHIKQLAEEVESARSRGDDAFGWPRDAAAGPRWTLVFDNDDMGDAFAVAGPPLSTLLEPLELDPLTMVDDPKYLAKLDGQLAHVPDYLKRGLAAYYR